MQFGRYTLLRQLGQGGMAEVFLARLGSGEVAKYLAIKRLLPAYSQKPRVVRRLANEARLTVWLTHPNIVQVFDFGRIGDHYFIAMEYVDGCDLRAVIRPTGNVDRGCQLPLEVALDIGYQLCDALRFAHKCTDDEGKPLGIIHRDISPHNVLISRDGHPKLADFGVARAAISDDLSRPGAVLGKLSYMPPEQAKGLPYDARVDLYACGAVLHEMLGGRRPFSDSSRLDAASGRVPEPPSARRPSVPPELDALVLRAMAPEPEDRFQSAEELGDAILEQLGNLGGQPKPHQLAGLVTEALAQLEEQEKAPEEAADDGGFFPVSTRVTKQPVVERREYEPGDDSLIEPEITAVRQFLILPRRQDVLDAPLPVTAKRPALREEETTTDGEGKLAAVPSGTYELGHASTPVVELPVQAAPKVASAGAALPTPAPTALAAPPAVTPTPGTADPKEGALGEGGEAARRHAQRTLPMPALQPPPPQRAAALAAAFRRVVTLTREHWQPAGAGALAVLLFFFGVVVGRCSVSTSPTNVVRVLVPMPTVTRLAPKVATAKPPASDAAAAGHDAAPDAGVTVNLARRGTVADGGTPPSARLDAASPAAVAAAAKARRRARVERRDRRRRRLSQLREAYRAGNYRQVIRSANRLLRQQPKNQSALALLGAAACQLGRRQQAASALRRLTKGRRTMLVSYCRRRGMKF